MFENRLFLRRLKLKPRRGQPPSTLRSGSKTRHFTTKTKECSLKTEGAYRKRVKEQTSLSLSRCYCPRAWTSIRADDESLSLPLPHADVAQPEPRTSNFTRLLHLLARMSPVVVKNCPPNMKQWEDPIHLTMHYKTKSCHLYTKACNDYAQCPHYHSKKERRRAFGTYRYSSQACELVKVGEDWKDPSNCPMKDECPKCHTRMEQQFHPEVYKKMQCKDLMTTGNCPRGLFCAFAHFDGEVQGKRRPDWNFDWEKILPLGTLPQYNNTNKTKPSTLKELAKAVSNGTPKNTPAGWKVAQGGAQLAQQCISFVESPKPERLPYSFAAIVSGNKDDAGGGDGARNNKKSAEISSPAKNGTRSSTPTKELDLPPDSSNVLSPFTPPSCVVSSASAANIASASFADILAGVKSSSEMLPNRLGSVASLSKLKIISATAKDPIYTPLPARRERSFEFVCKTTPRPGLIPVPDEVSYSEAAEKEGILLHLRGEDGEGIEKFDLPPDFPTTSRQCHQYAFNNLHSPYRHAVSTCGTSSSYADVLCGKVAHANESGLQEASSPEPLEKKASSSSVDTDFDVHILLPAREESLESVGDSCLCPRPHDAGFVHKVDDLPVHALCEEDDVFNNNKGFHMHTSHPPGFGPDPSYSPMTSPAPYVPVHEHQAAPLNESAGAGHERKYCTAAELGWTFNEDAGTDWDFLRGWQFRRESSRLQRLVAFASEKSSEGNAANSFNKVNEGTEEGFDIWMPYYPHEHRNSEPL